MSLVYYFFGGHSVVIGLHRVVMETAQLVLSQFKNYLIVVN